MVNIYQVKKFGGLSICSFIPVFAFFFTIIFGYGLIWAIILCMAVMPIGMLIFLKITSHPLLQLIEGKGILVLTFDSTGVIEPVLAKVRNPLILSKIMGKEQNTLFNRDAMFYTKVPAQGFIDNKSSDKEKKEYTLTVMSGKENDITYSFGHFPTFIFNKNIGGFLTKECLQKIETDSLVKHNIFYLKHKTEELTSIMRDFARYVVEQTKPRGGLGGVFGKWWFWVIVVVVVALIALLMIPAFSNAVGGMSKVIEGPIEYR